MIKSWKVRQSAKSDGAALSGCFVLLCNALLNLLLGVDDLPLSVVQSCAYLTSETVCLPLRLSVMAV